MGTRSVRDGDVRRSAAPRAAPGAARGCRWGGEGGCTPLVAAVRGRDAALRKAEQRAGEIVIPLVDEEVLSLHQVVDWCDGEVTFADLARMRRTAPSRETP